MNNFLSDLKRRIGNSKEIILTREELFILTNGYIDKDNEPLEKFLLNYLDKIKYKIKDDEAFLEIKEELQDVKSRNLSEQELILLMIKIIENVLI
ncbi:hypothetical protein [Erysipelothrix rhusiopathiae]|uniref:hypothetical protein n=1 Tax=Erysipelothrix rhusiopathiae TaxID=1648 RepID=UPI003BF52A99